MLDSQTFFATDDRVHLYKPGWCNPELAKCVLYWMQRAQRGQANQALNSAIALGNALNLPVIVIFVVTDFPNANLRHYQFMLEGLAGTAHDLQKRGTPLVMRRGAPAQEVLSLALELRAVAIISDENPLREPRLWRQQVAEQTSVPFACVDADVVVPSKHFPKEEYAARTLRPKLERLLPAYLQPIHDLEPAQRLSQPPCDPGHSADPLAYLTTLTFAQHLPPSPLFKGGQAKGQQRLQRFLEERLEGYAERRNQPELAGTSELSAYLHFGQLAVQQVAWEISQYVSPETESAIVDSSGGRPAYLEELIIRRELAINFAWRNPHYDDLSGCPAWGLKTLLKHAHDPRKSTYSLAELEEARTHDDLWNACQREMVSSGRMHGYLRMYWAKKILEWVEEPEEAFRYAVYLNDTYELDGRDANGYTGIAWALGGRHDRPWGPERPIFGLVRTMTLAGMRRKFNTQAYIAKWLQAPT